MNSNRSSFDPRGGKCEGCDQYRSLLDGLCAECNQMVRELAIETDSDGEEWTPGGFRL